MADTLAKLEQTSSLLKFLDCQPCNSKVRRTLGTFWQRKLSLQFSALQIPSTSLEELVISYPIIRYQNLPFFIVFHTMDNTVNQDNSSCTICSSADTICRNLFTSFSNALCLNLCCVIIGYTFSAFDVGTRPWPLGCRSSRSFSATPSPEIIDTRKHQTLHPN